MTVRDERFESLLGAGAPLVAAAFDALPDAIGIVWPVTDATGALVDFEVGYTNLSSPVPRDSNPETRIMIPRNFGSTEPFAGTGGHKRGHTRAAQLVVPRRGDPAG